MTHVVIEPSDLVRGGGYRLTVDGVDISQAVKADSLRLSWDKDRPVVELVLLPEDARVDLPDAVVRVVEVLS